jgi:hypothetical protein
MATNDEVSGQDYFSMVQRLDEDQRAHPRTTTLRAIVQASPVRLSSRLLRV